MFKYSLWSLTSHIWLLRLLTFTRRLNVALMLKHNTQRKTSSSAIFPILFMQNSKPTML
jgi:hypothetical protein